MAVALERTELPGLQIFRRGKVRDVYDLDERLLLVATDRISAFDHVLSPGIPDKGRILTQISNFWFGFLADLVPNHLIFTRVEDFPAELRSHGEQLEGRSVIAVKTRVAPVECVVRGYLAGSGWKEYQRNGAVCGIALPPGLTLAERLPQPIFTPSTKAETGHDENISFAQMEDLCGVSLAAELRRLSLAIYEKAAHYAAARGIIIADTKFEFGTVRREKIASSAAPPRNDSLRGDTVGEELLLIDEVLTPDSSRFWPADSYRAGSNPASFDKQFVRDYLESSGWNKEPPAPRLPPYVVEGTRQRYLEAHRLLCG